MEKLLFIGPFQIVLILLVLIPLFFLIIAWWKVYEKSNNPGWSILIPIYSTLVFLRIIEKPWYWLILFCIPFVNLVFLIWSTNLLSKKFGKDEGFTVGLLLLPFIFIPILGYGSSKYQS